LYTPLSGVAVRGRLPILVSLLVAVAPLTGCGGCGEKQDAVTAGSDVRFVIDEQLQGLRVRLTDAVPPSPEVEPARSVEGEPLTDPRVDELLALLPPTPSETRTEFSLAVGPKPPEPAGGFAAFPPVSPEGLADDGNVPLSVVRAGPAGEVDQVPGVAVVFSAPMVDPGDPGKVPVRIRPAPPGGWRWVGATTAVFEPEESLPRATDFRVEVPAGIESLGGATLDELHSFTLSTPTPVLQTTHPFGGPHDLQPVIFLGFDQRVDAAALLPHVSLISGDGVQLPLRLATADEVRADAEVHRLAVRAEHGCWVALRPRDPLPRGSEFDVVVGAGAPSGEGPRTTPRPQSFSFTTFGQLFVEDVRCGWGAGCTTGDPWVVRLSNPIDPDSIELADIEVEPPQSGLLLQVWEDSLSVEGVKCGRTRYHARLPGTLRDVFGQPLESSEPLVFDVAPATQTLAGPDTGLLVIAPGEPPVVRVQAVDHDRLRVRIHRVSPSDWPSWVNRQMLIALVAKAGPMPGERLCDHVLVVEGAPGRQTETVVDLGPYLEADRGQFAVQVQPVGSSTTASVWVQVTDLAVAAFTDPQDLAVWVTSLSTGAAVRGAEVVSDEGSLATTDPDGLAVLPRPVGTAPVVVRSGADVAILPGRLADRHRPDRMVWYVTDQQGVYRPGESVRIKGWLRRQGTGRDGDLGEMTPGPTRVAWGLVGPSGRDLTQGVARVGPLGGFDLTVQLPLDTTPGRARLRLFAVGVRSLQGTEHEHAFHVVLPTEREPALNVESGPHRLGEEVIVGLATAPPRPGRDVRWAVESVPTTFAPPGWEGFRFGPSLVSSAGSHDRVELFDGQTDAAGRHHLGVHFESMHPPHPMLARVEAVVGAGEPAMSNFVVHPSGLYLGLRPIRPFVRAGETAEVEVVAVDVHGVAAPRTDVTVRLALAASGPGETQTCRIVTGGDPAVCGFQPGEGGSYRVIAEARDGEGRPCETEIQLHVAGNTARDGAAPRAAELIGPVAGVRPGEDAEVLLRAPFAPASGVLTVRRAGLLETRALHLDGPIEVLTVPVNEQHVPNLDMQVDLGGPGGQTARGRLALPVDARSRALDVVLVPREAEVTPGGKTVLGLSVTDADGRPALGAELFVVAVPAESDHRLADPLSVLYSPRADEVVEHRLRDLRAASGQSLPDVPGVSAPGGASTDPLVHLPGLVVTASTFADASGTASLPLRLPTEPGDYRVMAVAASGGKRFGHGETGLTVRAPLTADPAAPRFLRLGDRAELPVVLHNRAADTLTVDLAARLTGATLGDAPDDEEASDRGGVRVTVEGGERIEVRLPVVPTAVGMVRVELVAASGTFAERMQLDVPVRVEDGRVCVAGEFEQDAVGMDVALPSKVWRQVGGLEIATSPSARLLLSDALGEILDQDGAGSEPIASAILALAPQRDALSALALPPRELEDRVSRDIVRLLALQNPDGGFPLWRAGEPSHPFASTHACHALARAHEHQYDVPWSSWTSALAYLGRIGDVVRGLDDPAAEASLLAYALLGRCRMGDVDRLAARQALDEPRVEPMPAEACGWLLPVLSAAGERAAAAQLVRQLEARASLEEGGPRFHDVYARPGDLLYGRGREDGIVLDALVRVAPDSPLVESLAGGLLQRQLGGRTTRSPQACFELLALDGYLDRTEKGTGGPMSRIWLGPSFVGERVLRGVQAHRVEVPMSALVDADDAVPLVMQRRGGGALYHHVGLRFAPAGADTSGRVLAVSRALEGVDDPGDVRLERDGTWVVRAGARVRVQVIVAAERALDHVAVTSPLPAGVTPAYTEKAARAWYDHEVVGDDRAAVYVTRLGDEVVRYEHVVDADVPGEYTWPPARAGARYDRLAAGSSTAGRVVIE